MTKATIRRKASMLIALLASVLFAASALAQTTGWISDHTHPPDELRLMLTGEADANNQTLQAVLDVKLADNWKTYWRSPGEAGIAPELDWSASNNIKQIEWHWPVPRYFKQLGIQTLGYQSHVAFPLTITLEHADQPAQLSARLRLPSCTDICVITDYPIEMTIDPRALKIEQEAMFLFNQGLSQSPRPNNDVHVSASYWDDAQQQFIVQLINKTAWQSPQVLVDGHDVDNEFFGKPRLITGGDSESSAGHLLTAIFNVSNWKGHVDLSGKSVVVTVADTTFATEIATPVGATPIQTKTTSMIAMIAFALIGGLILNVMPCVLPVLGLKLNSIALQYDASAQQIRASFIASALGIITSFALLAGMLTALKMGGGSVGWGIQFQSVQFIVLMLSVTFIFALNLLGLFEFRLPSRLNTWAAQQGKQSYLGHFVQGMFATLLATPCSAPFLGTAVAYALGASIGELWVIFIALGIGMNAPWLLFAIAPKLVQFMPKPGVWMNRVKIGFGLMMLATTYWLISLLSPFFGVGVVWLVGLTITLFTFIWLVKQYGRKVFIPIIATFTLGGGTVLLIGSLTADHWATPTVDDLNWQTLRSDTITQLTDQGKTVFVDVTADWCITCKANKIGVILQDPVYSELQKPNMVLMKGDWTTPNDNVTQYLHSNGRYGVPFNIVYGPNAPKGIPLPVILSEQHVMEAIKQASK
ncbi:protein-disulfide reductase DsbD family protein [Vibrio renipiscarius]|uniref:Cytochrome C biogenesis protein n=1 Tax=Vibrio renipiscarius TaxID=1461322 RepID=A0A0C2NSM7_9VIBR|nr:protein-disulfide reductase DsbD domain-containing protein [Vibrio renipiscarius]KII77162.1 cytochrome C biogenesis protein [Vibrio renipiscarius]KII77310.1 cytochrome C biogenesis protein [Vibrio renipiscarius]